MNCHKIIDGRMDFFCNCTVFFTWRWLRIKQSTKYECFHVTCSDTISALHWLSFNSCGELQLENKNKTIKQELWTPNGNCKCWIGFSNLYMGKINFPHYTNVWYFNLKSLIALLNCTDKRNYKLYIIGKWKINYYKTLIKQQNLISPMIPCLKVATFSNVRCHLLFFVSYLESSDLCKRHIWVTLKKIY